MADIGQSDGEQGAELLTMMMSCLLLPVVLPVLLIQNSPMLCEV